MKNCILWLILGTSLLFVNCNETETISEDEKAKIANEIKERLDGYPEALKRKDIDWYHNFWSNEKGFALAGDGIVETNYDSILKGYTDFFPTLGSVLHFKFSDGHAYILNKNAASYITSYDWGIVTTKGDTVKSRGSWLYVFHKFAGTWKVVHSAGTHIAYK